MFGLTIEQWEVINGFANWLAAIGTIAAVFLSLHLAREAGKCKGKMWVGKKVLLDPEELEDRQELVAIRVVNTGDRPIHIVAVGWRIGRWRKHSYFLQRFNGSVSSPLPVRLQHGEDGMWCFKDIVGNNNWYASMCEKLRAIGCVNPKTMRAIATTSTGQEFVCKPDSSVLSAIEKEMDRTAKL